MVYLGLGTPAARAFTAFALTSVASYVTKLPAEAFDEEGRIRSPSLFSPGPGSTDAHFLVLPMAVATAAYLFT